MRNYLLKRVQTMTISKVPWRKPPIPKQAAVICTRLILPDAVPAVKKHAIQRGSERTICHCKDLSRTATGGAGSTMPSIPIHAPTGQVCDSCLIINSDADRGSCMCPRQSKSSQHFLHKSPHFCMVAKVEAAYFSFNFLFQESHSITQVGFFQ